MSEYLEIGMNHFQKNSYEQIVNRLQNQINKNQLSWCSYSPRSTKHGTKARYPLHKNLFTASPQRAKARRRDPKRSSRNLSHID